MKFAALIPARGGSKGVPRKNIKALAGRHLLAYTAEAALACESLLPVILSTDSEDIASVGRDLGLSVPFLRPAELALDDTPMLPVLQHALHWLVKNGQGPDALVLLQPSSPFRTAEHIKGALARFQKTQPDSLVSVMELPHQFNPQSVQVLDADNLLTAFLPDAPLVLRRQDKPKLYARNGPAILIVSTKTLAKGLMYGPKTIGYVMDGFSSLDIDTEADFRLAEAFLLRAKGLG